MWSKRSRHLDIINDRALQSEEIHQIIIVVSPNWQINVTTLYLYKDWDKNLVQPKLQWFIVIEITTVGGIGLLPTI